MGREDEMRTLRDIDILPIVYAKSRNGFAFFSEDHGIEHDAVADEIGRFFVEDARGYLVKNDLFAIDV